MACRRWAAFSLQPTTITRELAASFTRGWISSVNDINRQATVNPTRAIMQ